MQYKVNILYKWKYGMLLGTIINKNYNVERKIYVLLNNVLLNRAQ